MDMPIAERRQIENEMIFRRTNELVGASLGKLDSMYVEDGNRHLVSDKDILLEFRCECSNENCEDRIPIKLSAYKSIHLNRDNFIVKINHQIEAIEKVILLELNYCIVEKNKSTTDPGEELNITQ